MNLAIEHVETARHGAMAVASIGLASSLACFLCLLSFAFGNKISPRLRIRHDLVHSQFGAIFGMVLFSDLIAGLGFACSFAWTQHLASRTQFCMLQAVLITSGDLASALFTMAVAFHTSSIILFNYRPSNKLLACIGGVMWLTVFLNELIPPLILDRYFVPVGPWCFSSNKYPKTRFFTQYMYIMLATISTLLIYLTLSIYIAVTHFRSKKLALSDNGQIQAACRMLLYPLCYFLTTSPLALYRILSLAGNTGSLVHLIVAGCAIASSGLVNVILYCYTRKLVSFRVRRPSMTTTTMRSSAIAIQKARLSPEPTLSTLSWTEADKRASSEV